MKTSIRIAALVLSGIVFVGCDDKKDNTVTVPAAPATPTVTVPTITAPSTTDTSGKMGQINNAIDKGAANAKSEADKLLNSAPTTAPALPSLGK